MNPHPNIQHDDGLAWLRDVRRRLFTEAGGI